MSKIVNTLKKGTGKARLVVILAILAAVAALGFIALAVVLKQLLYFFGTVICAFITISLKQTLDVYEYQGILYGAEKPKTSSAEAGGEDEYKGEYEDEYEDEYSDETDKNPIEDTDKKTDEIPDDAKDEKTDELPNEAENENPDEDTDENGGTSEEIDDTDVASLLNKMNDLLEAAEASGNEDADMDVLAEIIAETGEDEEPTNKHKHKRKHRHGKKEKKHEGEDEEMSVKAPDKGKVQEEILEDELEKDLKFLKHNVSGKYGDEEEESKKLVVVKPVSDEVVATYDKKKIKRTMHKYKVKRDHRLIIIDHCDKYYIKQTPAYVWVSDKEFNILLIEEEPRHLVLPLYGIKEITYLKKCPVNADTDYPIFHKKTLLTDTFRPYLPDYTQSTVVTDLTSYKNLYGFGPGIYCTNRSAKNLFDLLSVEFTVDDKVTMSNKVNIYFKECYKAGILLRDNVIDANGYADMISNSLDDMAKSTISNNEFKDTLNLLVRNKIITKEFSDHYMDVRNGLARS